MIVKCNRPGTVCVGVYAVREECDRLQGRDSHGVDKVRFVVGLKQ